MKVLVVTNDFPPRVGGVNGYVAELMRRFPPGGVPDAEVRERHGLDDHPVISCVARLTLRKGQDKVIRAIPWILREIPDARFLVVGDGPDRDRLEWLGKRKRGGDPVG